MKLKREHFHYEDIECYRDGMKIFGQMYIPDTIKEVYPAVIISHGYNSSYKWNAIYAKMLAAAGIIGIVYDFCGGSEDSESDGNMLEMSVQTEVKDLNAVIDYVMSLNGIDKNNIFLMGESQGGVVTALAAAKRQKELGGIVLFYPAFVIPDHVKSRFNDISEVPDTVITLGATVGKKYYEDVFNIEDIYKEASEYTGKVLIVHGDKDELVPLSYSVQAVESYDDAELIVLHGADHGYEGAHARAAADKMIEFVKANAHRAR